MSSGVRAFPIIGLAADILPCELGVTFGTVVGRMSIGTCGVELDKRRCRKPVRVPRPADCPLIGADVVEVTDGIEADAADGFPIPS